MCLTRRPAPTRFTSADAAGCAAPSHWRSRPFSTPVAVLACHHPCAGGWPEPPRRDPKTFLPLPLELLRRVLDADGRPGLRARPSEPPRPPGALPNDPLRRPPGPREAQVGGARSEIQPLSACSPSVVFRPPLGARLRVRPFERGPDARGAIRSPPTTRPPARVAAAESRSAQLSSTSRRIADESGLEPERAPVPTSWSLRRPPTSPSMVRARPGSPTSLELHDGEPAVTAAARDADEVEDADGPSRRRGRRAPA